MNVSVLVDLQQSRLGPEMEHITGQQARASLHAAMGEAIREETRVYLAGEAAHRHSTANRLGGTPTGYLEQAARAVEASPVTADAAGGELTLNHPGLGRAFHDVTIVPSASKFLTIPVDGRAYGHRAREFPGLFVFRSKTTGNLFLAERGEKGALPNPLFLLVKSVTQKQDRTLLPSAEAWQAAAVRGAEAWLDSEISST